ncbi:hypothetical protein J5N97_003209 [Dioscorea zingiberensis]|uniref:GH18 domain-containing protein n=1 Tax=Dioscorea zingiberensis TaxID=325984 RepID=A0A9D5D499_9LILI|nr:hypothetical protein J5N97_003209 [Dioscorea zingiberensis]
MSQGTSLLLLLLLTTILSLSTIHANSPAPASSLPPVIKAGYWPSWSFNTLPPNSIHFSYFTHVLYAFIPINSTTFELSISPFHDLWLANFTTSAHSHSPPVSALMGIAGGSFNRTVVANLVSNPASRATFIASTINIARKYNLDGMDLDWEFPSNTEQMENLAQLFKEWRAAIDSEAAACGRPRLLLTSSVYFSVDFFLSIVPRSYPASVMAETLDWINAMCFDYHGWWNTTETGAHAALFDPVHNISTSYGLSSWVSAGMPAKKVVMGMPLYGRTFELKEREKHGIGAPGVGVGPGIGGRGIMVYGRIVEFNMEENATVVRDEERGAVYSYVGDSWLGYDDRWSVRKKIDFAKEMGLGGYFLWALGFDYHWSISQTAWSAWEN